MKPIILSEYAGTVENRMLRGGNIEIYAAVTAVNSDTFVYSESINDLSTSYEATSLQELLSKCDHMLLARAVVNLAINPT